MYFRIFSILFTFWAVSALRDEDHGEDHAITSKGIDFLSRRREMRSKQDTYARKVYDAVDEYDAACNRHVRSNAVDDDFDLKDFDKDQGKGKSKRHLRMLGSKKDPYRLTRARTGKNALRDAIATCRTITIEEIAASITVKNYDKKDCDQGCNSIEDEDDKKDCEDDEKDCEKCAEKCDNKYQDQGNYEDCFDKDKCDDF